MDRAFHQAQHQAARAETVRRILALHADTAWISLRENGFVFWARVPLSSLQAALGGCARFVCSPKAMFCATVKCGNSA